MGEEDQKIGEELPDNRVYAGVSPRTGRPMYLTSQYVGSENVGVAVGLTWEETKTAMKNLAPHGWRLPTKDEVDGLMEIALERLIMGAGGGPRKATLTRFANDDSMRPLPVLIPRR